MCVAMLFGSLFTFPSEMKMLLKERSSGMYNLSAYYISRSSASMPLELLYPTVFTILSYWMGALRPQVSHRPVPALWLTPNMQPRSVGVHSSGGRLALTLFGAIYVD